MFEKFTEKYFNKTVLKAQASSVARRSLQSVKPKTQKAVLDWLDKIHAIKNDSTLSPAVRKKKLLKLETSEVVSSFVWSLLGQVGSLVPAKKLRPRAIDKVGTKLGTTTVSLTKFALPTFVNSSGFDSFSSFVKSSFMVVDKGDHHIPEPSHDLEKGPLVSKRSQQKMQTKAKLGKIPRHETNHRAQVVRGH